MATTMRSSKSTVPIRKSIAASIVRRSTFQRKAKRRAPAIWRSSFGAASMSTELSELIYDWNADQNGAGREALLPTAPVGITDETLRDGLQSPSVCDPGIEDKVKILHLMAALGISAADLGLPGAGARARADVERLAREILDHKLKIRANCAARTVEADIKPIAEVAD